MILTDLRGVPLSTDVNGALPAATTGQAVDYLVAEVRNVDSSKSFSGGRLWIVADPTGGGFAVAVLDAVARATGYSYSGIAPASGSYSSPTTSATGLVLPTLAAGTKCLVAVRRDVTTVTTDPTDGVERNSVRVTGSLA